MNWKLTGIMVKCVKCTPNVVFKTPKDFLKHFKEYHCSEGNNRFQCPFPACSVTFSRFNRFDVHVLKCSLKTKSPTKANKRTSVHSFSSVQLQSSDTVSSAPDHHPVLHLNDHPIAHTSTVNSSGQSSTTQVVTSSMEGILDEIALEFALSLHAQPNLTRKDVFKIQTSITDSILTKISDFLIDKLSSCSCPIKSEVSNFLQAMRTLFGKVENEYRLNASLKKFGLVSTPKEFVINREVGVTFVDRRAIFGENKVTGTLMPLAFQVSEFVKRNNRVEEMISNMRKFSQHEEPIMHYIQGSTWKEIMKKVPHSDDTIYLPLGLYNDGLQYNNALGSHKDSVDNIYYYFPLLEDPFHKNNIHLATSIRSDHIKAYGNGACFQELVEALLDLYYTGFEVSVNGRVKKIKFLLGLVIGDNLALNAILEYVMSFMANFFCRICTLSRAEAHHACIEMLSKLRTIDNYNIHLNLNDLSKTGIKGDCVFNQLPYWHCILNKVIEIMHDFFEGTNKYVLCKSFVHWIEQKVLTLEELNGCIRLLDYAK